MKSKIPILTQPRKGRPTEESEALSAQIQALIEQTETEPFKGFFNEVSLLKQLPVSRRTLGYWKEKGILPYIKLGRRVLYHWPSVEAALLRLQREAK